MNIYPSILETSTDNLIKNLNRLFPVFDHFQIDIADGEFVETETIQIADIAEAISSKKLVIPDGKTFEFHLMVHDYSPYLKELESLADMMDIIYALVHFQPLEANDFNIRRTSFPIGISLNPEVEIDKNWDQLEHFRTIQLMTVNPGKQGQAFIPEVLNKIKELREHNYKGLILLDGAMNDKTLPKVLEQKHLPNAICPGSYFKNENPKEALAKLTRILGLKNHS